MKYRIADLNIEMDTFGKTLDQAEPYLCDFKGDPDFTVTAQRKNMLSPFSAISDNEYEYVMSGFSFSEHLLHHQGLVLHASAIAIDGTAYCFSADSGVGKSTHTQLYQQYLGNDKVQIINDDKPAFRLVNGIWKVYGTPWSGKTALNLNICRPLAGICFLERGSENVITRLSSGEALKLLIRQNPFPTSPVLRFLWISSLDGLLKTIPFWKMNCNMTPEAAAVSYTAMSGKDV